MARRATHSPLDGQPGGAADVAILGRSDLHPHEIRDAADAAARQGALPRIEAQGLATSARRESDELLPKRGVDSMRQWTRQARPPRQLTGVATHAARPGIVDAQLAAYPLQHLVGQREARRGRQRRLEIGRDATSPQLVSLAPEQWFWVPRSSSEHRGIRHSRQQAARKRCAATHRSPQRDGPGQLAADVKTVQFSCPRTGETRNHCHFSHRVHSKS